MQTCSSDRSNLRRSARRCTRLAALALAAIVQACDAEIEQPRPAAHEPVGQAAQALSWSISLGAGYALVANPFNLGGNTVAEVLPNVPDATNVYRLQDGAWVRST